MVNNEWERFGDEIRRTIQNAVDSRDFSRLNQTIADTVNQAVDNVSRGIRNGGWYRENPMNRNGRDSMPGGPQTGRPQGAPSEMRPVKQNLYLKGTTTKIGGAFLAATGYIFGIGTL